jgi:phage terminase large subunit
MNVYQFRAKALLELDRLKKERNESEQSVNEYYQTHICEYLEERFGIKREMLQWSLMPEYKNHKWDGTPDPFYKLIKNIENSVWTGIESAKGVGKTFLGAHIALTFFDLFKNSIVVTVAPKEEQLKLHIWKEIGRVYPKFNKGFLTTLKLRMEQHNEDWAVTGFGVGTGAIEQVAQNAAGFHAEHMLIIFEETPGINQKVIDSFVSTSSAPHNIVIAFGNPDHQLDNLNKFCKLDNVDHIRISGYDFPNVVLNNPAFIPGGQSRVGLERLKITYRSDSHPLYLSHARGISPGSSPDSLIKYEWCMQAVELRSKYYDENEQLKVNEILGETALGVDVANSETGDEAAVCEGKGNICIEIRAFACPDAVELADDIHKYVIQNKINQNKLYIDGIGVGAATVNTLKKYGYKLSQINFIGSEKPADLTPARTEKFNNRRSQAWWMLMVAMQDGIVGMPYDPELITDLTAPKWELRDGKICIESKKDIKKRIGKSPNKGDAFVYWWWNNVYQGIKHKIIIR